ncbi:MAG: ATP synthase F1 subunit delta [Deltaproteobacteria bacterium]|nr:MAG: ATP synthase F1 subunit delta [Deltaproteobacteria bacterium]
MIQGKVARRYAKALYLLAEEEKADRRQRFGEDLHTFATLVAENDELREALFNPIYPAVERTKIIRALGKKLKLLKRVQEFLAFLVGEKRISYVMAIDAAYQQLLDVSLGRVRAHIVTATPLDEEVVERLRSALQKMLDREPIVSVEHDPGVIGGIRLTVGSTVYDGTVQTRLENLREALIA